MRKIGFVLDSTFGYKGNDAKVVPLKVIVDGKEYIDGELDNNIVVDALKTHKDISTSQPSPNHFLLAYEEMLEKYDHVICLTLSKTLSGTVNSANLAADMLENDRVTVIDTGSIAVGANDIFLKSLEYANEGHSLEDVVAKIEDLKTKGSLIFSVDDLSALVRGGRLGRISGFVGSILKIKPILRFKQGVLAAEAKVRGLLGAFKYIVNQALFLVENGPIDVKIIYVDNEGYANRLFDMFEELNNKDINVQLLGHVTPVVSTHVGLGGMGIYLATI